MNEELRLYWALRDIDDEAARIATELARLPALRRAEAARVSAARESLAALEARHEQALQRRRALELEIAAFDAQYQRFEKQLAAVTDQKQFEAVQHELSAVRAKRSDVETAALECLETEEQCAGERPVLAAALERILADAAAATAGWDSEEAAARARLAGLDAARGQQAAPLAAPARSQYERLRGSRDGRAVAAIEHGACGACFQSLSPHAAQEARKRERMLPCEGCGRLLLLEPGAPE